jgi:hypothetical protein
MKTSDLNTDIDLISRAVDWAETFPRDPDSWKNLRNKIRDLRQSLDIFEAKWQPSNQLSTPSPLPWTSPNSSEWSEGTLAPASEPAFLNTKSASPDAKA